LEHRLAAIPAADIANYSRLMGQDEKGTLSALQELRADTFVPTVNEYQGTVIKSMGDG
jgi:class 3 adenylate cyclase